MKLGFYTAPEMAGGVDFGCLTQGFSDAASGIRTLEKDLEGKTYFGSYEGALSFAKELKGDAKAAVVFTDGAGDENRFVRQIASILCCPVVGGGAARTFGKTGEGFCAGHGDIAVCVITGGVSCRAEKQNLHTNILEECTLELSGSRIVTKINGMDALAFLREQKEKCGFAPDDYERMTLSTMENVNAHLSEADGIVKSGRDLDEHMLLRAVVPGAYQETFEKFYQDTNAMVFGCAGLKAILERPFASSCAGAFLFGEICVTQDGSDFGNLMLSRLIFE